MFALAVSTPPSPQQQKCLRRWLDRAMPGSRFDRGRHLRIMCQVDLHVRECGHVKAIAISSQGPGGDLFFVLRHYQALFTRRERA